jgi:hypothetical protein
MVTAYRPNEIPTMDYFWGNMDIFVETLLPELGLAGDERVDRC